MLTEEQRKTIEARLLRMREDALDAIGHFDADNQDLRERAGEMSVYRFHPADLGTEMEEREKEFLLASQEGRRLYEIDDALRRLYREPERFGVCAVCGKDIEWERLDVIPETAVCAADARAGEEEDAADPREAGPV
jgi:RNA polymerase-binding transcription factor DksA